ncbi:hypothetical protein BD410DRAFT_782936 [Rickenella mellea]|uniref:Uncharacterized protein n=1 Tax=Rickenella mellea TaxID=50990 RepID=A0A4Y7QIB2_9AGAM|nr:hypothetical protein BD410DRAFT_782936 [Rickenella mellea]
MTESTEDMVANLANNNGQHPNNAVSLVKEKTVVLQIPSSESIRTKVALQDQKELNGVTTPLESTLARARLDNSNSIVASIPDEVLSEIFVHCLPSSQSNYLKDRPPVPSVQSAPLLLTRVCRRWADVALSTHHLWAGMTFTKKLCDGKYDQIMKAVEEWIGRSGACPLSFDFYCGSDSKDEAAINKLAHVIIPHSHRWRSIGGYLPSSVLAQVLSKISDGVPLLEMLGVSDSEWPSIGDGIVHMFPSRTVDISFAPRLNKFCSENIHLAFNGAILRNIRTIEIGRSQYDRVTPTLEDVWSCLQHCPNLRSLEFFATISSRGNLNLRPDMLQVAALQTFLIYTSADPGPLLDRVTSPALKKFHLSFFGEKRAGQIAQVPWHNIDNLLERSRPPLQELTLNTYHIGMSEDILLSCLRRMPDIKKLYICVGSKPILTDYFLHMMTIKLEAGHHHSPDRCHHLCPRLQNLSVEVGLFTADAMVEMILSRRVKPSGKNSCRHRTIKRLSLVCCEFEGRSFREDDPALRQCIEGGVKISILNY